MGIAFVKQSVFNTFTCFWVNGLGHNAVKQLIAVTCVLTLFPILAYQLALYVCVRVACPFRPFNELPPTCALVEILGAFLHACEHDLYLGRATLEHKLFNQFHLVLSIVSSCLWLSLGLSLWLGLCS